MCIMPRVLLMDRCEHAHHHVHQGHTCARAHIHSGCICFLGWLSKATRREAWRHAAWKAWGHAAWETWRHALPKGTGPARNGIGLGTCHHYSDA